MATYRLSAKTIGRSAGRSATGAAAYRAGERIVDRRTGIAHDYTARGGVVDREILAPMNAPEWVRDRAELWNRVEEGERRKDAQLCREVLISLPHEVADSRRRELVRGFVREAFVSRGMVVDVAIHRAHERSDQRNHHAHILLTLREIGPDGFGPKVRSWNDKAMLVGWRESWEQHVNRELERARVAERVSSRSLRDRGLDREPEPRQGPVATGMERAGRRSRAGDDRRAAKERNAQRARLRDEARQIEAEIREEERRRSRPSERDRAEVSHRENGIRCVDIAPWQAKREHLLSDLYEREVRGSRLARYWRIERTRLGLTFENARGRFEDRGENVVAHSGNSLEIKGMLDVAELKGWRELVFTGTEQFKREGMAAALDRGYRVHAEERDADLLRDVERTRQHQHPPERVHARVRDEGWTR